MVLTLTLAGNAHGASATYLDEGDTTTASPWDVHALGYGYVTQSNGSYAVPVVTAERNGLHVEARYNYEDFYTASFWVGAVLAWDGALHGFVTPMIGATFGRTTGISPGVEAGVQWDIFEFYTEGQYVFDLYASNKSFMYYWTELTATILPWLEVGAVSQRTRVIRTDEDLVAGAFVGYVGKNSEFRIHVLEPGDNLYRYWILSVDVKL